MFFMIVVNLFYYLIEKNVSSKFSIIDSNNPDYYLFIFSPLKMIEIVVPELHEMRTAHLVSIGSECISSINPDCEDGYVWIF